jgi:hypothetical protein
MKNKILIAIVTLFFFNAKAQNIRGLYVDGLFAILGDTLKEDSLLRFAQTNGFNYLTLYEVNQVNNVTPLNNFSSAATFANFISKAKTQFGMLQIGVAGESYNFFKNNILPYNQQHPLASEKIDVYNVEFEFWVPSSVSPNGVYCNDYLISAGYSCDTSGAFAYYKKMLFKIDSLANANGSICEAYFGWFNQGQGAQIINTGVDRILLSVYITSANYASSFQYNTIQSRLENLASAQQNIKVIPIYSAEPVFMQSWTQSNPFFFPFGQMQTSLAAETAPWKNYIQLEGIQWFKYTDLPKININLGMKNDVNHISIKIFPNPNTNKIEIVSEGEEIILLKIWDNIGHLIIQKNAKSKMISFESGSLPSGLYVFEVFTTNGSSQQKCLIQ